MTQPELSTPFVAAPLNQQAGTGTMRSSADIARDGRGTEAAKQAMLAQRQALLDGPVLAVMLKLALPTVIVLVVQSFVGVAETYFVSFLGTDALAGVALVFPILMLMQMMSNGGIGGGVASAVARAIGAGRKDDADALVLNALVLAIDNRWRSASALSLPSRNFGAVGRFIDRSVDKARRWRRRLPMPMPYLPERSWSGS